MRISVDATRCEAHGMCAVVDPDLFPIDEDGHSAVGSGRPVPAGEEPIALDGIATCPVRALSVDDRTDGGAS